MSGEMSDDLDPGVEGGWADFDVIAPEGWISPALDCPHGGYVGYGDPAPDARGVEDRLADAERLFRKDGFATEAGYRLLTYSGRSRSSIAPRSLALRTAKSR